MSGLRHRVQYAHRLAWQLTDASMEKHRAYVLAYPALFAGALLVVLLIDLVRLELRWRHPRRKECA